MVMSERSEQRALELAKAAMDQAAPGILAVGQVADLIQGEMGMSRTTARRYVRLAIDARYFIELRPGHGWQVTWPAAERARLGTVRLCMEVYNVDLRNLASRLYLAHESEGGRTRKVNPGNTTYVMTAAHGQRFIRRVKDLHRHNRLAQAHRR